jgi:hypothetical protein
LTCSLPRRHMCRQAVTASKFEIESEATNPRDSEWPHNARCFPSEVVGFI